MARTHRILLVTGLIFSFIGLPTLAQAQLCFDIFEDLADPTLSCADTLYFVENPDGGSGSDQLFDGEVGLLGADFDGFDIFDEAGLERPENFNDPFFSSVEYLPNNDGGLTRSFNARHRGSVAVGPRDSTFQQAAYGTRSRIEFTPIRLDGGTNPINVDFDLNFDFTLGDPQTNSMQGAVLGAGRFAIFADDFENPVFEFNGVADLDTEFSATPGLFADFDGPETTFGPSDNGFEGFFDIDVDVSTTVEVTPGQPIRLETDIFGSIFTDGFESGDVSAWTVSSGNTFDLSIGSSDPNVRFLFNIQDGTFPINAGLNDAWFNRATSGQGFFVIVFPQLGQVFLAWFTYDTQRPAAGTPSTIGEPGHRWITAFGPYLGDTAELKVEITEGGVLDSGQPMPTQREDGTITLQFAGCNEGTVTYNIPSLGLTGVVPIERLALDNVAYCEQLSGTGLNNALADANSLVQAASSQHPVTTGSPSDINPGMNDAWFNPLTDGQGFFMNVFANIGRMFVAWFTYDAQRPGGGATANLGDPGHRWFTAFGPYEGSSAELEIEVTEGGIFNTSPPEPTQQKDGTLMIDMQDCENGTISYDIASASLQGQIPIRRLALDNVPYCESFTTE